MTSQDLRSFRVGRRRGICIVKSIEKSIFGGESVLGEVLDGRKSEKKGTLGSGTWIEGIQVGGHRFGMLGCLLLGTTIRSCHSC